MSSIKSPYLKELQTELCLLVKMQYSYFSGYDITISTMK